MFQSHVIETNGVFIGAAVPTAGGFRFRAVHPQVDELDGFKWPSLDALRQATAYLFRTGRLQSLGPVAPGALPLDPAKGQSSFGNL